MSKFHGTVFLWMTTQKIQENKNTSHHMIRKAKHGFNHNE